MLKFLNMDVLEGNIGVLTEVHKRLKSDNTLNIIQLSKDARVQSYLKGKIKACEELGVLCVIHTPSNKKELEILLSCLSKNKTQKIIIQTPIDEDIFGNIHELIKLVDREQDVDGFDFPLIKFREYRTIVEYLQAPNFSPTAKGVLGMMYGARREKNLDHSNLRGETITIIGTGLTSGLPIANACMSLGATVYTAGSSTTDEDLRAMVGDSTIVVSCCGVANKINKNMCSLRENAVYINVGMSKVDGKLAGDINYDEIMALDNTLYCNKTLGTTGRLTCLFLALNTVL